MLNRIKKVLTSKQGISLLETLIALTILTIIAFCFLPLFSQYMTHIKKAGKLQQETQYKISLMERLIANKGDNPEGYEIGAGQIPLTFYCGGDEISFNTQTSNTIKGTIIKSDDSNQTGGGNTYVTFSANSASAQMVCFPNELTDDFIKKDIYVVAKGFKFAESAFTNKSSDGWHFEVAYTDDNGNSVKLDKAYYDVEPINDNGELVAKFTFYGGNEYVSFEKSPFIIGYGQGSAFSNLQYTTKIRIGAPEIIFVGEKAKDSKGNDDGYYYYSTAGVDENGNMDIIAKQMSGSAKLTSAMNDVEWVEEGRGDDGKGGVNKYGYYIMGGDAGQVRRFWMKKDCIAGSTSENFCWGGDVLNNYYRYAFYTGDNQADSSSVESFNRTLTQQASFVNIFRSNSSVNANGESGVNYFAKTKVGTQDFHSYSRNYFSANVTSADQDRYFMAIGDYKAEIKESGILNSKKYTVNKVYYGPHTDLESGSDKNDVIMSWLTGGNTQAGSLNADGYKAATGYEYPQDQSLITITSVGAVQINKSNANYNEFKQTSTITGQELYPKQSYTLYCGYIPAVLDQWGKSVNSSKKLFTGTFGAAYSSKLKSWVPTGRFGDINTTAHSASLNAEYFDNNLSYTNLLKWKNEYPGYESGSVTDKDAKRTTTVFGVDGNFAGTALPEQDNDYNITGGQEVDVTMGYLSEPFALVTRNPQRMGENTSNYFTNNHKSDYKHSFISNGLRDFVTMLDVKSFHDDLNGNNISFAVGYTMGIMLNNVSWYARNGQVMNMGMVYIRSTGDGSENDSTGSTESGKGWSLKKEANVFHEFYSLYQQGAGVGDGKYGEKPALGWNTWFHLSFYNTTKDSGKAPQPGYSPEINNKDTWLNTHPMAQTECTTVNKGVTWDEKPEVMWGTENGTLMGWTYDYENLTGSKITAVRKEFESYMWWDRYPDPQNNKTQFYDYTSTSIGQQDKYGFISVLKSVNDVSYGDGFWVAVGDQSGKAPKDYCASNACYTENGDAGSYINVKYDTGETRKVTSKTGSTTVTVDAPIYAWKAVKVSDDKDINFVSVTYSRGVWYAMGYKDSNGDGENNRNGGAYIYYSRNPAKGWERAKTRNAKGEYTDTVNALLFEATSNSAGSVKEIKLTGINSMASRG